MFFWKEVFQMNEIKTREEGGEAGETEGEENTRTRRTRTRKRRKTTRRRK